MYKLTVLYPYEQGKWFDMDYYCNVHMMDPCDTVCLGAQVEFGLSSLDGTAPPKYICIAHCLYRTLDELNGFFKANKQALINDLPNFTNIVPEFQISEEMMNFSIPIFQK